MNLPQLRKKCRPAVVRSMVATVFAPQTMPVNLSLWLEFYVQAPKSVVLVVDSPDRVPTVWELSREHLHDVLRGVDPGPVDRIKMAVNFPWFHIWLADSHRNFTRLDLPGDKLTKFMTKTNVYARPDSGPDTRVSITDEALAAWLTPRPGGRS